jgi:hypothetical protein
MTYSRHGNRVGVKIAPAKGSFDGQLRERSYSIELPCTQEARQAQVDHKAVAPEYLEAENLTRVTIPPRSIRSGCEIVVDVADADQASLRAQAYARRSGVPSVAPGTSWADLVSSAADKASGEREKAAVLAAAGRGTFSKIESPTGYPATGTEKTYASER